MKLGSLNNRFDISRPLFAGTLSVLLLLAPAFADDFNMDTDMDIDSDSSSDQGQQPTARQRMAINQEADAMMSKQVREVASWMENYCSGNVAFPDPGDEQNWVITQLTELVPYNPYQPGALAQAESAVPIAAPLVGSGPGGQVFSYDEQANEAIAASDNRIRIQVDFGMTFENARQYQTNPPDDWQANPGTITIVSTNEGRNQNSPTDFFLVWGAGANGSPVRDPYTGRVVMVQGRWMQILGK